MPEVCWLTSLNTSPPVEFSLPGLPIKEQGSVLFKRRLYLSEPEPTLKDYQFPDPLGSTRPSTLPISDGEG